MSRCVLVGLALAGCGSGVDEVTPRPYAGASELGDANGDGAVDIADAVFVERYLFDGGASPPCEAAANFAPNTLIEVGDGFAVLGYLFLGYSEHPALEAAACAGATPLPNAAPARFGFEIVPPAKGESIATVTLHAPEARAQAWSFGVRATGCSITQATTLGTTAADSFDGGARDVGFDRTNLVEGGAVSAVLLSWKKDVVIGPKKEGFPVLKLELGAAASCDCEVSVVGDLAGVDRPVELVIASEGRSYRPAAVAAKFRYCGG